jgi:hypothetical protein
MREEVRKLVSLGKLPSADSDTALEPFEVALQLVVAPVTDEEAEALLSVFGSDECFGLAWTLLHLVETSPTPFPQENPGPEANPWHQLLYTRAQ